MPPEISVYEDDLERNLLTELGPIETKDVQIRDPVPSFYFDA